MNDILSYKITNHKTFCPYNTNGKSFANQSMSNLTKTKERRNNMNFNNFTIKASRTGGREPSTTPGTTGHRAGTPAARSHESG